MIDILHGLVGWLPVGLPAFLFVITVVVFFHELGHFSVARFFNVTVETFSIGFGRSVAKWTDKKGTEWKIGWLPLGGYVKFLGDENGASVPDREILARLSPEQRANVFQSKPLYQRALVVAAGPIANFILAIVIFSGVLMLLGQATVLTTVGKVTPGAPAAVAGIRSGDVITAVNGAKVETFNELVSAVRAQQAHDMAIGFTRQGKAMTVDVKPRVIKTNDLYGDSVKFLGIGVQPAFTESNARYVALGPVAAVTGAAQQTWFVADTSLTYLWRIVTGHSRSDQLTGPLGMASVSKQAASAGFMSLLQLAALLSVSIGLINLFPVPILDGGHLLYYGCEAVLGRPLGERAQDVGFRLGLAAVLGLFVLATWNDLVRLNLF
ncbi:MAG: RIP metalloprotease RseP [Proteobacteria bacterium]|nr:RIP metalloprotease RseP [Pseudomonadota bacterium]